jgi:hypothetical protein
MITTFSNQKSNLVSTKTLIEMLSFLKIEKDGTEIKNTLLHPNIQQCIRIADNTYKYEEKEKKVEIKTEFEIRIKNKEGKKIFSCELKDIYKIVDKQRNEGKLTILIEKDKSKYFIFLFKSTKEAIEHFLDKINVAKNNINKNTNAININTNINSIKSISTQNTSKNISKNENLIKKTNVYNKRKFNELYKKQKNDINIKRKKEINNSNEIISLDIQNLDLFKDIKRIKKQVSIPVIYLCEIFPDYLTFEILNFLDIKSLLWKVCLINKELKKICDSYIDKIKLKDDTPNEVFHRILSRFSYTRNLVLGKAKNFNNSNIKEMIGSLKYLQYLDISNLENINDKSIHRLLVKTKGVNIISLKLNAYLESLHTALCYCLSFYKNMTELSIINNKYTHNEKSLLSISQNTRYYRSDIMNTIIKLITSNIHKIKYLNLFIFNAIPSYNNIHINSFPFKNLLELNIDLIIIKEIKDLQILNQCEKLEKFKLGDITFQSNENKLSYIDIDKILDEQSNIVENEGGEIDFENEPTEVFGKIFYYMKNMKEINFGNFLTNEICQLISIYFKQIEKIKISSEYIKDDAFKMILLNCKNIKEIDLRGCDRFLGTCFLEVKDEEFPKKLTKAKFSVQSYNFYHVTNFLINKGIKAENYIMNKK